MQGDGEGLVLDEELRTEDAVLDVEDDANDLDAASIAVLKNVSRSVRAACFI